MYKLAIHDCGMNTAHKLKYRSRLYCIFYEFRENGNRILGLKCIHKLQFRC